MRPNKAWRIFRRGIKAFEFSGTLMLSYMQNSLLLRNNPTNSAFILKDKYKSLYMRILYPDSVALCGIEASKKRRCVT